MEGRLVGRLSRPHKVRVPDGPDYLWFPRRSRFLWRRLAGSAGRRAIYLNPYILDKRPQAHIVYVVSHEYLHWLVYRLFDARTARRLHRLRHGHHSPIFDRLKLCIEHNNRRASALVPQAPDSAKRVLRRGV